jgi:MarR family transcriptional regulator, negative regulator of the multidrug operon emrRAB
MHIAAHQEHALNVIGAWSLAVAEAIERSTVAVTGIAGAAPAALVAVAADPDMSIDELRRTLDLTHPGAVRLVDRLEGCGWMQRRPGRGRTMHLRLTAQGRRTHRHLLEARREAIAALTQTLDPAALERVAELIAPSLTAASTDTDRLRHLCRLCRRSDCDPCPVAAGIARQQPNPDASPR